MQQINKSKTLEQIQNATEKEGMVASRFFMELELIHDPEIRKFVKYVLINHAPDYFWSTPASKSGKHHSEDERKEGGLVRHVKRMVRLAEEIMKGLGWFGHAGNQLKEEKRYDHDVVIAACLLHDIYTAGPPNRERKSRDGRYATDRMHPYYVRDVLFMVKRDEKYLYKLPFFDDIMRTIEGHYGFWSVVPNTADLENAQSTKFICYMADYIASRNIDEWFKIGV